MTRGSVVFSMQQAWEGFRGGNWESEIDVRGFIQRNYTPYEGDEAFLAGPTERTSELWGEVMDLFAQESAKGGVLDMDTKVVTTITSHGAGYIDKPEETIVGLQTDKAPQTGAAREWRHPHGPAGLLGQRLRGRPPGRRPSTRTIARPTTPACSTSTRTRCAPAATPTSSRGFPTPTAVAASSATTGASRSTAPTS
jgi:hypothetical protein